MIPTKNLPTCPLSICPSIHPSIRVSIYQFLQGTWHCVFMIKDHLLKTYCQTVSNVESIFAREEMHFPFHERAGANVCYLDHPASQGGAGRRHPWDTRTRAAFPPFIFNGLFFLPGSGPSSECGASSPCRLRLEQSPIHHIVSSPVSSCSQRNGESDAHRAEPLGGPMTLVSWRCPLYSLGGLGFCPASPRHLRAQEYKWRSV